MGFLATLMEFSRTVTSGKQTPEAKVDRGGGDAMTAHHFSSPGDDSFPLAGDVAYLADDEGTGTVQIVGYQDAETAPVAEKGEKRIYSRSGPGVVAAEIWLKADGSIIVKSASGSLELGADGAASVKNDLGSIDIAASGDISFTTPLGKFGAATHMHPTGMGPSGPPMPNT